MASTHRPWRKNFGKEPQWVSRQYNMIAASLRAALRGAAPRAAAASSLAASRPSMFSFASGASYCVAARTVTSASSAASAGAAAFRQQHHHLALSFARRAVQTSAKDATSSAAPSVGLVASLLAFPKAQPFAFNIIIATIKTSIADAITQVGE